MTAKKLTCTGVDQSTVHDLFNSVNSRIPVVKTMVMLGASIMNSAFFTPSTVDKVKSRYGFKEVAIVNEAVAGNTTGDLLARLQPILDTYAGQEGVVFPIHIGGNDVSNLKPYATATETSIAETASNIQTIITMIRNAGHRVLLGNISYRTYNGTVPPESAGSLPFNTNIVEPTIRTMLPELWDGDSSAPFIDTYTFLQNNTQYLSSDGVHLTDEGGEAWRQYWFGKLSQLLTTESKALSAASGSKVVFDFNDQGTQTNPLINSSGEHWFSGNTTTSLDGVGVATYNRDGLNAAGRGNAGDTTTSLTNNILLLTSIYTSGQLMTLQFSNMEPNITGTLKITASRSTNGGDRVGEYTVQGVTNIMNSESLPAPQSSFNFTTDEYGSFDLEVLPQTGSTFAYLNGAEITLS